jgi:hypothetical protein
MASRREFDEETANQILVRYADVVKPMSGGDARGGCMAAVYNGIVSALYGETYAKDLWRRVYREAKRADTKSGLPEGTSNSVNRIMEILQTDGRAGEPWVFSLKAKKRQCTSPVDFRGLGVKDTIRNDLGPKINGWYYFYGISASSGYHSVGLEVDNTTANRKIYWLDQFTKNLSERRTGYLTATPDVTNNLDQVLLQVGEDQTRIWPLYNVDS